MDRSSPAIAGPLRQHAGDEVDEETRLFGAEFSAYGRRAMPQLRLSDTLLSFECLLLPNPVQSVHREIGELEVSKEL